MQKITPFLWFDGEAEAAAAFYTGLFEGSRIVETMRYGEAGPGTPGSVMAVTFELAGQRFSALNGGPHYQFTPAISLFISCESQAEIDRFWDGLAEGGTPVACGWITDRFGVTWQVVPAMLGPAIQDPDRARASRVMKAMMGMVKLDIAALEAAGRGEAA